MTELPGTVKSTPERALEIASTWIGTPYRHQASLKGIGTDCIGLIIGIWKELYGCYPSDWKLPKYTPYWAEETGLQLMVDHGKKYLQELLVGTEMPGDIIMYKMFPKAPTKHAGIVSKPGYFIHAYSPRAVVETTYLNSVGSEITHAFRFPDKPDLS